MKKNLRTNVLGVITLIVTVFFFFACDPVIEPNGPDPDDPTPTALVKSVVAISPAENVTETTAKLVAYVIPNEKNTKVSFEYKISTEANFHPQAVSGTYTGTDSIKITFDLSNLTANSEY